MLVYRLTPVSPLGHRRRPILVPAPASPAVSRPWRRGTMAAMRALPDDLSDRLIESVPNVSEGRRLDVVDRLAAAVVVGAGRPPPRPHERRQPQPLRAHDRRSGRRRSRPPSRRLVAAAVRDIDMDAHTGEHPRIGAVDVVPFVPLGDTTMDEASSSPGAFGARIAERFDLPVYLYARAATRPDRVKLADVRRGQYEGLKAEIAPARPRAGLRAGADAPVRRGGRRRRPAVPHRLQHQPRHRRPRAREADRPAGPRVRRRPAQGPGQRVLRSRRPLEPAPRSR